MSRGNFLFVVMSVSPRGTTQPSTAKWFLHLPTDYNLTATVMDNSVDHNMGSQCFGDNHYIIHTNHPWPWQMQSRLLIGGVKTLAIIRVLTLLINKLSCICEGRSWWVRILRNIRRSLYSVSVSNMSSLLKVTTNFDGVFIGTLHKLKKGRSYRWNETA